MADGAAGAPGTNTTGSAGAPGTSTTGSAGWGAYVPNLGIVSTAYWVGSGAYSMIPDVGLARAVWGEGEKPEAIDPVRVTSLHEAVSYALGRIKGADSKEYMDSLGALIGVIAGQIETVPGCKQTEMAVRNCDTIQDAIRQTELSLGGKLGEGKELPSEVGQFLAALQATAVVMRIFPACLQAKNRIANGSVKREESVRLRRTPLYEDATREQRAGFDRILSTVHQAIESAKEQLESAEEERTKAVSMLLTLLTMGPLEKKEEEEGSPARDEISAEAVTKLARAALGYAGTSLSQCDIVESELPSAKSILETEVEE